MGTTRERLKKANDFIRETLADESSEAWAILKKEREERKGSGGKKNALRSHTNTVSKSTQQAIFDTDAQDTESRIDAGSEEGVSNEVLAAPDTYMQIEDEKEAQSSLLFALPSGIIPQAVEITLDTDSDNTETVIADRNRAQTARGRNRQKRHFRRLDQAVKLDNAFASLQKHSGAKKTPKASRPWLVQQTRDKRETGHPAVWAELGEEGGLRDIYELYRYAAIRDREPISSRELMRQSEQIQEVAIVAPVVEMIVPMDNSLTELLGEIKREQRFTAVFQNTSQESQG